MIPRMMKRKTAAQYCDLSEAAFVREIIAGRLPAGVMLGGREHWCKNALDSRRLQKMATFESAGVKTAFNPGNGIASEFQTICARVEHHADAILRAAGSGLRHYSMDGTRRAILSAVLDCYEEAYRAGADRVLASYRAGEVGK